MTATAERCNGALGLALKVVQARGDKPTDPKIWQQLLLHAPPWTVMRAAFLLREQRREERQALRRERRRA